MPNNNSTKAKNKPPITGCRKYEQAITHFAAGQQMDITREELFAHLKNCKECRKDLSQWQDTLTVMKTEAFSKTAEGQAKMKGDFAKLKAKLDQVPVPGQPVGAGNPDEIVGIRASNSPSSLTGSNRINTADKYGTTAGVIWQYLGKNGKTDISQIAADINIDIDTVKYSVGWLLGQEKLCMSHEAGQDYFWLVPAEMQKYQNIVLTKEKEL